VSVLTFAARQASAAEWLEVAQNWYGEEAHQLCVPTPAEDTPTGRRTRPARDPLLTRIDTELRGTGQVDLDVVFGPRRVAPWDRLPFGAQISNAIERAWSLTQGDADAIAESPTLAMLTGLRFAHVQESAVAILVRDEPTRYAWAKANNELGVPPNNVSDVVFRGAVLGFAVLPYPVGRQYATELLTPYMAHIHRTTNPVEVKA
jgi:hypothetical protein